MILIKNLIFDFGGVIYDIDFESARRSFNEIGINNFEEIYSQAVQSKIFELFECDLISVEDFRNKIQLLSNKNLSARDLDIAWNSLLVGFKPDIISLLEKVRDRYQIFLFSNTNRIHYDQFINEFKELTHYKSFDELFIKSFFSFNMKLRKPDKKAYEHLIKATNINASETLFIDDSIQNIQAAQKVGLHTYHIKGELTEMFIEGELDPRIILGLG